MHIHYLFHSGFLAETANCYYVFDFYRGELPLLQKTKPVLVFSSHRHPDHYNQEIFNLLKRQGMEQITAVLSKDIPKEAYPQDVPVIRVTFHEQYDLPYGCQLKTLLSTDEGVAFLVTADGETVFHAGDLNWWHWEGEDKAWNRNMEVDFKRYTEPLRGRRLDLAMLPLDPRLGEPGFWGPRHFLELADIRRFLPMHQWGDFSFTEKFLAEYPGFAPLTLPVSETGQVFAWKEDIP